MAGDRQEAEEVGEHRQANLALEAPDSREEDCLNLSQCIIMLGISS